MKKNSLVLQFRRLEVIDIRGGKFEVISEGGKRVLYKTKGSRKRGKRVLEI